MLRITVWNENLHEKRDEAVRRVHPEGIHTTLAKVLGEDTSFVIRTATLEDPECGLTEEVLQQTDVLFWWGHMGHHLVPDEIAERVHSHVLKGMGLVVLHSGHNSKIFKRVCGTACNLTWHDEARERLFAVNPAHPIAKDIPPHFQLEIEECYGEPFGIPEPNELVFLAWYNTGEVFRAGCCFYRGNGRIFYFQPGHETYRSYEVPEVGKILRNAAHWAAPQYRADTLACPQILALEDVR